MISFLTIDLYHKHKNHSALIGKREISPQLCCGDEWRVEFEAAVAASLSKKTTLVSCANTPQLCLGEWRDLFYFLCKIVLRIFLPSLDEVELNVL